MRWLARGVASLAGLALTLGLAEIALRVAHPTPRVQVVHPAQVRDLRERDGVWLWRARGDQESSRADVGCGGPGQSSVLLAGSSITYGVRVPEGDALASTLRQRLAKQVSPPPCVIDVSQAGFVARTKAAAAMEVIEQGRPVDLVVFEIWINDLGRYTPLGDALYNLSVLQTDGRGRPAWPPGMPEGARAWLFDGSSLFAYAALALAPARPGASGAKPQEAMLRGVLDPLHGALASKGIGLALWLAAPMDKPFRSSEALNSREGSYYSAVREWAEAREVPVWSMADAWDALAPEDVRLDRCCHLDPSGHRRLAEDLGAWIAPMLSSAARPRPDAVSEDASR